MRYVWIALTLCAACGGSSGDPDAGDDAGDDAGSLPDPEAVTTSGPIAGVRGDGFQAFLGIPFAAPPVGELRFRPPQPVEAWTEVRPARTRPPRCVQEAFGLDLPSQEDCLYLNVHTPDPPREDAPVMVWMHGGGFIFGEGLQTDDGTAGDLLAARYGVVVVSMNYRLGPYGFLAHPDLTAEQGGASGNYGIQDQQVALQWVQDNIEAFGGDPDNVTIFGESAGGMSVCVHLVAAGSRGLFHRAISQSGLCDIEPAPLATAEADGTTFAESLGCTTDVLTCLRDATVEEIKAVDPGGGAFMELAQPERLWWPNVDGEVLTRSFRDSVAAGDFADVPTIFGWNADEGTLFVMLAEGDGPPITDAQYMEATALLADYFSIDVADVRAQYPLADYADPGAALADALGHASLACPSRRAARLLAEAGGDVRVYRFEYPDAGFQLGADRELGAFHSAEIQFVFGHPSMIGQPRFRGDEVGLNDRMSGYWVRFAATGDPNGASAPAWPAYDLEGDMHLALDIDTAAASGADAEACALWAPAP
jgi:para-nitrobenzyl esterase